MCARPGAAPPGRSESHADRVPLHTSAQMKHWQLSGRRARKAMASFFHKEEVHSEASHLEDYVDNHPFLGDHPRPSMSAAIQRYCTAGC